MRAHTPVMWLVFAALYLRNLISFEGSHLYAMAATRLDMLSRKDRRQQRRKL